MPATGFVSSAAVAASSRSSTFTSDGNLAFKCATKRPSTTWLRPARRARALQMQLGSPSIQIGRPKTSIKKNIGVTSPQAQEPETDTGKGAAKARPRRKTQAEEIPMYKVILLGDEEYIQNHVVTQLQKIVQLNKETAMKVFSEAQTTGSSIVCVVCEETAEFYAEQLKRQELFVTIEKDE